MRFAAAREVAQAQQRWKAEKKQSAEAEGAEPQEPPWLTTLQEEIKGLQAGLA